MRIVVFLLATLALTLVAAAQDKHSITSDGTERHYVLLGVKAGEARPLILALHGNRGSGAQFARYAQWQQVAAAHQVAIALPDGLNTAWNDGREPGQFMGRFPPPGTDDVKFLTGLVEHLVAQGVADKRRVYVTGISNGGIMTYRLLCDRPELFAAAAAVIATLPEGLAASCHPGRPVPLLIMNGTADRLITYDPLPGKFIGTEKTAQFWSAVNGCNDTSQREWLPDRDKSDGSRIERIRFACPAGRDIVLDRVEGGGHQMPSLSTAFALEVALGRRNHDVEGVEEIWAFVSRFSR